MTAKEYLYRLRYLDKRITGRVATRDRYAYLARGGTSGISALRNGGTNARSKVEDYVCRLVDLERELDAEIDELVNLRREALGILGHVPDMRLKTVLELRYFQNCDWDEIARDMRYDLRWVYRLHGIALIAFEREMPAALKNMPAQKEATKSHYFVC